MDWLLVFTGESCLGEHAIKDQQFITLSLSTNPPVFFACLPVVFARRQEHAQAGKPCPVQYYFMGPDATMALSADTGSAAT